MDDNEKAAPLTMRFGLKEALAFCDSLVTVSQELRDSVAAEIKEPHPHD